MGLTLKEVHERTGLSVSFLSEVERGKTNPSVETLKKLANCYNVPVSELVPEENRELPNSLEEAREQLNISDEIIDLMMKVEFRSDKKYNSLEDWRQLYYSLKTLLGE
jgi:transcriptional regulator with XRE-family HTH domain